MSSDDAVALAGQICATCVYPRFADLIRAAITNCTLDAAPLDDEQCEALYRAALEAGDGMLDQVAHTIDHESILAFRRELEGDAT